MAEGLLNKLGDGKLTVESAGVTPSLVRLGAVEAMRAIGIDISGQRSKSVDEFAGQNFDFIITVCDNAKKTHPVFSGSAKRIHYSFVDPPPENVGNDNARLMIFREVRDEFNIWLADFVRERRRR